MRNEYDDTVGILGEDIFKNRLACRFIQRTQAFIENQHISLHQQGAGKHDPLTLTTWSFGFATAFWALLQPWKSFPWSALQGSTVVPTSAGNISVSVVALAIYMVLFGTVITFAFVNFSLRHLSASQASVVGMTEPLMASAVAWLALGERLGAVQILGGVVVLIGILLAEFSRYRA